MAKEDKFIEANICIEFLAAATFMALAAASGFVTRSRLNRRK
jgi:hypothetical protein